MEGMGGSPPVADWSHWSHCTAKYIQDTGLHWTLVWATAMDWIDKSDWVFSFQQLLNWCQSPLKRQHNVALHNYLSLILSKNCRDVVKSTGNTLVQFFPSTCAHSAHCANIEHRVHIVHTVQLIGGWSGLAQQWPASFPFNDPLPALWCTVTVPLSSKMLCDAQCSSAVCEWPVGGCPRVCPVSKYAGTAPDLWPPLIGGEEVEQKKDFPQIVCKKQHLHFSRTLFSWSGCDLIFLQLCWRTLGIEPMCLLQNSISNMRWWVYLTNTQIRSNEVT